MENEITKLINKVDSRMMFLEVEQLAKERLSRLEKISKHFSTERFSQEKVKIKLEFTEQLSKDLKLPLKVRGMMLKESRPKKKFYSGEELSASVNNPINNSFPIIDDHETNKFGQPRVKNIIGAVDKLKYNENKKVIEWFGHINSELYARNVMDGLIKEVSATIQSVSDFDENYGLVGVDLVYTELSLVMDGAVEGASIMVDK